MNDLLDDLEERTLTVRELIGILLTQPQELKVRVEGCDCDGPAGGVRTDRDEERAWLLIERAR